LCLGSDATERSIWLYGVFYTTYSGSVVSIYTLTTTNGVAPLAVAVKAWGLAIIGVIAGGLLVL